MNAVIIQTRTGRWAITRQEEDRLARVRDRSLRDLVDQLDDAVEVLLAVQERADASGIHHGYFDLAVEAVNAAIDYLRELREQRAR
jgi:hypothetical protein